MTTHTVDARNLLCPMPVIRLQEQIALCAHGDEVILMCTDPGVQYDVPDWCEIHAHELVSLALEEASNVWKITVRVHRAQSAGTVPGRAHLR